MSKFCVNYLVPSCLRNSLYLSAPCVLINSHVYKEALSDIVAACMLSIALLRKKCRKKIAKYGEEYF